MSAEIIGFKNVFNQELEELRKRRRYRGERENGLPEPVAGDNVQIPYFFNALLDDLKRWDEARRPASTAAPGDHASVAGEVAAAPTAAASKSSATEGIHRGLVGLALSGGGIRSASFCLGALQALDRFGVFPKFDYMSTVSGGGYIGASLSSLYAGGAKEFPFRHQPGVPENGYLRHLRGYCNYLAPRGMIDYLRAPGIVLRGLVVNLIVLLPFVLLLAAATVWWNGADIARVLQANREVKVRVEVDPATAQSADPTIRRFATTYWDAQTSEPYLDLADLVGGYGFKPPIMITGLNGKAQVMPGGALRWSPGEWLLQEPHHIDGFALKPPDGDREAFFVLRQASFDARRPEAARATIWTGRLSTTFWLGATLLTILATYPVLQWIAASTRSSNWRVRDLASYGLAFLVAAVLIMAVVETQPIAIYYYARAWLWLRLGQDPPNLDLLVGFISSAAVLIGAFSGRLAKYTQYAFGRLSLLAIGALGPFVLWLLYLVFGRWALCGLPHWLTLPQQWVAPTLTPMLRLGDGLFGTRLAPLMDSQWAEPPDACFSLPVHGGASAETQAVLLVYIVLAVVLLAAMTRTIDVNRTSLHQFYRDRLSKAFLLRPQPKGADQAMPDAEGWRILHNDDQVLETLGGPSADEGRLGVRLPWLSRRDGSAGPGSEERVLAPYHLMNAAINTQSSGATLGGVAPAPEDAAEIRDVKGRKADFFLLSQLFVGSRLTGYCRTADMRALDPDLNLGTAMAISAAAAAPNMGTSTIKPLVFLMTVLNIRLGYWLPNPGLVAERKQGWGLRNGGHFGPFDRLLRLVMGKPGPVYLVAEMLGLLSAHSIFVNVSDGGHIENLGLYPLIQRRCRLIVAVDGERDPPDPERRQKFTGLATAIRYARIDLGVDVALNLSKVGSKDGYHFAVGRIDYGPGFPPGWLIYVKSSLTGDENTYVREYSLDRAAFPHESTGDQFFDEKQFECYRALGYHAMQDFLALGDKTMRKYLQEHDRTFDAQSILAALQQDGEEPSAGPGSAGTRE